jgi:hypothetical protein
MILALQLVLVEPEVAKDIEWVEEKCTIRLSRIAREFGILEEGRRWTRLSRWGISRCEVERWRDWRNWEVLLEQYQEKSE